MAESAAIDGAFPSPGTCVKCATDVTRLPATARFCNRCGSPLPARGGQPLLPAATSVAPPALPFDPPQILLAYARALFNLGWRYETAVGSRRNLEEAARCYWKAARLGDAGARLRFEQPPNANDPVLPVPPFATVYAPPPAS